MVDTTTANTDANVPFFSATLRSGNNAQFWKSYVESRPSPSESFFQLINQYHQEHGDSSNKIAHDVGTGAGNIAARLAAYFDQVVGSDLNDKALAAAPALIPSELQSRVHFVHSRAEDLPEKVSSDAGGKGTTDLVVVSECMPLLDPDKALSAFHTLLRPGGSLAIYFYGRAVFVDGDVEQCNAAYEKLATRICKFLHPMKDTPGFPSYFRSSTTLASYLDNVAFPCSEWDNVQRHKWNCDHPLQFQHESGYDFEFGPVDNRAEGETTIETIDRRFWEVEWIVDNVKDFLGSVYPNYRDRAGSQYSEVEDLLAQLDDAMGKQARKITFPVVLILATKKEAT